MGVRVSELPVTSNVAVDDKLMVLDVSEGVLKTTEVDNVGGGKELTQAQYDALTPAEQASGLYYITDAGGAESSGHTIQDSTTTFTSRANLKFANGVVSDDSTNDATVVNMPFVGTTAQVNAAISGGQLEDGQEVIITDDSASADANQNLASIEDGTTASKAYAVGDFIVHNGLLYKVTTAISSGGTLTPGTNISQTTAGAELSAINSDLSDTDLVEVTADGVKTVSQLLNTLYTLVNFNKITKRTVVRRVIGNIYRDHSLNNVSASNTLIDFGSVGLGSACFGGRIAPTNSSHTVIWFGSSGTVTYEDRTLNVEQSGVKWQVIY